MIIIPSEVRYDKRLTPLAKLIYGEIYTNNTHGIIVDYTNNHYAELYDVSKQTISTTLKSLIDCKLIESKIFYNNQKQITKRELKVTNDVGNKLKFGEM